MGTFLDWQKFSMYTECVGKSCQIIEERDDVKMKKWTRVFLSLLFVAAILLGSILPAQAVYFKDVTRSGVGSELFGAINYVSDNGIIVGTYSDTYSPNASLTRAMVVAILYRWSGDGGSYSNPFTDVSRSDYYYDAVGWAYQKGIVYGTTSTQFSPSNPVTKEQFFAFLYRYANIYNSDKTDYASTSISGHPDYNQVEEYAKIPLRWAKGHRVLKLTINEGIYPKLPVSRKYAAAFIARYSVQIMGFKEYEDCVSFSNLWDQDKRFQDFSNVNVLEDPCYARLLAHIDLKFGNTKNAADANKFVQNFRNQEWGGSCFGISMVTYLDKIGKIDFNKNTCGAMDMYNVDIPKKNVNIESAINYYQVSQAFPGALPFIYTSNQGNLRSGLIALNQAVANDPVILCYGWKNNGVPVGHAIIIEKCTKTTTASGETKYNLTVIDPNFPGKTYNEITVKSNGAVQYYAYGTVTLTNFCFLTRANLEYWNDFDFDGIYNNFKTYSSSRAAVKTTDTNEDNTTTLMLPYTKFTISNAEGQTVSFDGEKLLGGMEIMEERQTYSRAPCTLILTVPNSSCFTYTTNYEKPSFSVVTSQYSSSASGSGITSITIDDNGSVLAEGSNLDIRLSCYTPWSNGQFLDVKGTAGERASLQYTQDGITIEGFAGDGTIVVGDYYGNDSAYAFSFPDTLVTAKTLAELLALAEPIKEN